jgi:hypothetical protein
MKENERLCGITHNGTNAQPQHRIRNVLSYYNECSVRRMISSVASRESCTKQAIKPLTRTMGLLCCSGFAWASSNSLVSTILNWMCWPPFRKNEWYRQPLFSCSQGFERRRVKISGSERRCAYHRLAASLLFGWFLCKRGLKSFLVLDNGIHRYFRNREDEQK